VSSLIEQLGVVGMDYGHPLLETGMNSMLAVQLRAQLSHHSGVTMPSTLLFDHPSISAIQAYLRASTPDAETTRAHASHNVKVAHGDPMPLPLVPCLYFTPDLSHPVSHNQEQLFRIYTVAPDTTAYNLPFALFLDKGAHPHNIQQNLDRTFVRHDVLRCRYSATP
jgi:hypothetical protein